MDGQFNTEAINEIDFRLLSVAALIKKVNDNLTIDELYKDAERKFDTLIGLHNNKYTDDAVLSKLGYSLDDLKRVSLLIFNRLISHKDSNPYITLCVSDSAPLEEIKSRRNKLLHIFHPDRNREKSENGIQTRRIHEAYNKIANKQYSQEIPIENSTNIPPSYPYSNSNKNKARLVFLLIILFGLLVFLGIMNMVYFH